jgi:hypothetical protein
MWLQEKKFRDKKIMTYCVLVSFFLHFATLFFLQKNFLSFSVVNRYFTPNQGDGRKNELVSKLKEEDILIFAFDKLAEKNRPPAKKIFFSPEGEKVEIIKAAFRREEYFFNQEIRNFSLIEENIQSPLKKEISLSKEKFSLSSQKVQPSLKDDRSLPNKEINSNFSLIPDLSKTKAPLFEKTFSKIKTSLQLKNENSSNQIISLIKAKLPEVKKKAILPLKVVFNKHSLSLEKDKATLSNQNLKVDESSKELTNFSPFDTKLEEHKYNISNYLKKMTLDLHEEKTCKVALLPFLPHIPSLRDLNTISCGDDFDIDLEYIPRDDDLGYVFALTLIPKSSRPFKKINQNFFFLIDKSNSIQGNRYSSSRQAVASSISALNKSDTFNIYIFDNKIDPLFRKNKTPSHETITTAKKFMLSQKLGAFFSSKNLVSPFNEMLNNPISDDEINNIILISNGEELEKQKYLRLIDQWSKVNEKKQSLFILAMEWDKNLPVLELFAAKNGGKLIVSHSITGIRRNLVRLIKELSYPVAKNVSVNVYEKNKSDVFLYPPRKKESHLYYDQPYVLMGSVRSLDDFVIFIQGKNPDTWFNIKKEISFEKARKGGAPLKEKWAQYRASKLYDLYLRDGEVDHLKQAERILAPHQIQPAFKK